MIRIHRAAIMEQVLAQLEQQTDLLRQLVERR